MLEKSVGFIGGGEMTHTILHGLQLKGRFPQVVFVSDISAAVLKSLKTEFPRINTALNDNQMPIKQDIVIAALHPSELSVVLEDVRRWISPKALFISLAPKLPLATLSSEIGGLGNIARVFPNALLTQGYIPMAFCKRLGLHERAEIMTFFNPMGKCKEIPEVELETLFEKLKAA